MLKNVDNMYNDKKKSIYNISYHPLHKIQYHSWTLTNSLTISHNGSIMKLKRKKKQR